jgi:hypothetical protein
VELDILPEAVVVQPAVQDQEHSVMAELVVAETVVRVDRLQTFYRQMVMQIQVEEQVVFLLVQVKL